MDDSHWNTRNRGADMVPLLIIILHPNAIAGAANFGRAAATDGVSQGEFEMKNTEPDRTGAK
jgi:hypothetical protein